MARPAEGAARATEAETAVVATQSQELALAGGSREGEQQDVCPWTVWMKFSDNDLEKEFLLSTNRFWINTDIQFFAIYLAVCAAQALKENVHGRFPTCGYHGCVIAPCVMVFFLLWCLRAPRWPKINCAARSSFVVPMRIMICTVLSLRFALEDPKHAFHKDSIFSGMLVRTPLGMVGISCIGHHLPFNKFFLAQLATFLISWPWTFGLAEACRSDHELSQAIEKVGDMIHQFVTFGSSTLPASSNGKGFLWWMVGTYCHIVVGFIMPLCFHYLSEAWSRVLYLSRRRIGTSQQKLFGFFCDAASGAVISAIVVSQLIWVLLNEAMLGGTSC